MVGKSERVILLKGDATKWYNQAIFIVNQNTPAGKMPVDFVAEAEKIINAYMAKERKGQNLPMQRTEVSMPKPQLAAKPAPAKKRSSFDFTLNLIIMLTCIAIIVVFMYGMLA